VQIRREHRTEVTEVTEGDSGWGSVCCERRGILARNVRNWGEHRTEVTEGIEVGLRKALWWTAGLLGGKDILRGEHRTGGHRGHKGGLRLDCGGLFGGQLGFWLGKTSFGESIARRSYKFIVGYEATEKYGRSGQSG
jgi:hypothetical protein